MKITSSFGRVVLATLGLFATAASAFASGTHYYVNDHLATTVGIADAAGEIAALEADAFGSPIATGANPGRYTGKPYDEDMGAYVFPFRNYRAEEGRWMSADPSSFPDGINSRIYVRNAMFQIDPLGLEIVIVGSPVLVNAALDYVRSNPIGNSVYNQLQNSGSVYTINVSSSTTFTRGTGTILWDPLKGVQDSSNGARISPATALFHEMAHAAGYDTDKDGYEDRLLIEDPLYTNAEEKRVITQFENPFAQSKGEGVRGSHKGSTFLAFWLMESQVRSKE